MAGILNYNKGLYSTQEYRDRLLGRNLPPPVNETLTESGLVSKLEDIGRVINVPVNGTASENIQNIYNEEERMFPLGTFYRLTNNVNLNSYIPLNDEYVTYELTIPPNLGFPLPEGFGQKDRSPYPFSYNPEKFFILGNSSQIGVENPLNVIDDYKGYNFNTESSLGLIGGQELEKGINEKISYVREQNNTDTPSAGSVTLPNTVDDYINIVRGNKIYTSILTDNDIGWNEYMNGAKNSGDVTLTNNTGGVVRTTSTESRVNTLLEKTSETQVSFLLDLLQRNNYRPLYEDRRFQGTSNEGTNGRYYIGDQRSTNRGSFITTTFNEVQFNDEQGGGTAPTINNDYYWGDGLQILEFNEKTLLQKTKNLVDNYDTDVYINQTQKFFKDKKLDRLISRGSGIGVTPNPQLSGDYARAWTVTDNYSFSNAIRNKGLFTSEDGTKGFSSTSDKSSLSVLLDSGFPKVHPTIADSETTRKKFMFSIENLAWADNLADLPKSEIGPGDILSRNKGRIMWFPPYDLKFDETSSAQWDTTNFIGRGEPIYTYNSTTRTGSISFKILVDHPRVINCYRGKSDNLIERFNAGTVSPETFLSELECSVPQTSRDEIEKLLKDTKNSKVTVTDKQQLPLIETYSASNLKDINSFLENKKDSSILITCTGFLDSTDEEYTSNKPSRNINISKQNARKVYDAIIIGLNSDINKKNIKPNIVGKGTLGDTTRVSVKVETTAEKNINEVLNEQGKITDDQYVPQVVNLIDNLIIDENQYFDFIDDNYPNYFKTISEKIQYFQPGFHSITPEGFNSRLTFLNQCMRQGPSVYDSGDNVQPQNLSFGRPPVCILRIGDFFHTKVVITTLSITYDGPQFDFNPEGIGVQPMIASVTMSINYVGGNSLTGPINRLQNAVSFNYYANTEIYDPRADSIGDDGNIIDGIKLGQLKRSILDENLFNNYVEDLKNDGVVNQEKGNEQNGNDTSGNDGNVLEIKSKGSDTSVEIIIETKDKKKPSEIEIDGQSNGDNEIKYIIKKIGGSNIKDDKSSESNINITINYDENDIINPKEINRIQKEIDTVTTNLKTLQSLVKSNGVTDTRIDAIKLTKETLKDFKKELSDYKKGKSDKIKVVTFLTKNQKKTKTEKTFTITENGVQ
jgi:hypothetical protein